MENTITEEERINELNTFQDIIVSVVEASKRPINKRFKEELMQIARDLRSISDTVHLKPWKRI
jgi:propanediol dehydratase small subunit